MTKTSTTTPSAPIKKFDFQEVFLHYIWKTRNFSILDLYTTDGKVLKIENFGIHNHVAGPDFLDAKVKCGGIQWAGHVEIHVRSSDWYRHHHHVDPAYDQVILHVVWEDDRPVTDMHLNPIPTLEMKDLVDPALLEIAGHLVCAKHRIPCSGMVDKLSPFLVNSWKEHQVVERLQMRTGNILSRVQKVNGDWEQVCFEYLSRSLGFSVNSEGMNTLAGDVTWRLIRKELHNKTHVEAILFGRAGMLTQEIDDTYYMNLRSTYKYLALKYELSKPPSIKWNFKGARPSNFPTIRIAQLAAILHKQPSLLRSVTEAHNVSELEEMGKISLDPFWNKHYVLNKTVKSAKIKLSTSSVQLILINYVIPVLYAYGHKHQDDVLKSRAIRFLFELRPEKNSIIREFNKMGVPANSAAESQALIHTYRNYCSQRKCLECKIGHAVVQGNKENE